MNDSVIQIVQQTTLQRLRQQNVNLLAIDNVQIQNHEEFPLLISQLTHVHWQVQVMATALTSLLLRHVWQVRRYCLRHVTCDRFWLQVYEDLYWLTFNLKNLLCANSGLFLYRMLNVTWKVLNFSVRLSKNHQFWYHAKPKNTNWVSLPDENTYCDITALQHPALAYWYPYSLDRRPKR